MTPESLWKQIEEQVQCRFRYVLPQEFKRSGKALRPWSLIRSICLRIGIQLNIKCFSHAAPRFTSDDVLALVPVTKSVPFRCSLADEALEASRAALTQPENKAYGMEMLSDCVAISETVFGHVHRDTRRAYAQLGMALFRQGDHENAKELLTKAAVIAERCFGFDAQESMEALLNLAYCLFSMKETKAALALMKHVYQLYSISVNLAGPTTPDLAIAEVCIFTIYFTNNILL